MSVKRIMLGGGLLIVLAALGGCSGQGGTPSPETAATATQARPALPAFDAAELPKDHGAVMNGSGSCTICHNTMIDEAGNDVSTNKLWGSSMMANAARDPYWQATVESEVTINPALKGVIEDKCATCHMPAARFSDVVAGNTPAAILGNGYLAAGNPQHALAMDGVNCTVCHQIEDSNFGQNESFSGGYSIDTKLAKGERAVYGPFPIAQNTVAIMMSASGFFTAQSDHIQKSELCATCHTLYTPYLDKQGSVAGSFPEQTVYLEWQASQYSGKESCQGCHMPEVTGKVSISNTGTDPRSPVRAHSFLGGNTTILAIFRAQGKNLSLPASSADLDAAIQRNLDFMQKQAASVAIQDAALKGSSLRAVIAVKNLAGHKLPSSFPSRRAWLHVTVKDQAGKIVWESGRVGVDGAIEGNDNDADATKLEPHYTEVTAPDQVQIYESIMGDVEGKVTTTLLFGAKYLKDNRLLPAGFDAASGGADVAPIGVPGSDTDFAAGGDQVVYTMDVGQAPGPLSVTVEVLYQPIGYRWAQNLLAEKGQLIRTFGDAFNAQPNAPIVVASASSDVK